MINDLEITPTTIARFEDRCEPVPECGCWLWSGSSNANGYGRFKVKKKWVTAHRVSWRLFRSPIPDGLWVLHKCHVRECVNPDHLYLGTVRDNNRDCVLSGRHRHGDGSYLPRLVGDANYSAKLTASDVLEIRASKEPGKILAERYGVSEASISRIRLRQGWTHI